MPTVEPIRDGKGAREKLPHAVETLRCLERHRTVFDAVSVQLDLMHRNEAPVSNASIRIYEAASQSRDDLLA